MDLQLIRELGTGASGSVNLAIDVHTKRRYAVKTLSKATTGRAKIDREIRILERVSDRVGIVSLVDVINDFRDVHLVSEFVPGGDLESQGPIDVRDVFSSVALSIAYLHSIGVIHRDVKNSNIMRGSGGVLVDFGSAVEFTRLPFLDPSCEGTLGFAAPERLRGEDYPASDVWSLGVTVFKLLYDKMPFGGGRGIVKNVMASILDDVPCAIPPGQSAAATDFVARLLDKNHRRRMTIGEALDHEYLRNQES